MACVIGTGSLGTALLYDKQKYVVNADFPGQSIAPTKQIRFDDDKTGLKLTLFQFVTCPFCCKVRAMLNYNGISYDVVEVNSITRDEIKWSKYKKVPILVAQGVGEEGYVQLNDSTVIMSVLESYLNDKTVSLQKLLTFYPTMDKEIKGRFRSKTVTETPNKNFLMFQDHLTDKRTPEERAEERRIRVWVDTVFIHLISPNVYRTMSESLDTFQWFSKAGDWETNFTGFQRNTIIYIGGFVMYFIGKKLKRKYNLQKDVRESLYEGGNAWVNFLKGRKFVGGDQPNLADLSMYGMLTAMEGTEAFRDLVDNTKLKPWYDRTKTMVEGHQGANRARDVTRK